MKFTQAYIEGFKTMVRHHKMGRLLYAINFFFAILLAFPIFNFINLKLSQSLAADKLFDQFDYSIFSDILNEYGSILSIFRDQTIIASLLFFLLSIFLVGGILNVFVHNNTSTKFSVFFAGCAKYFWRMFRLTIYFLIIHGLVLFAFFTIYGMLTAGGFENYDSEKYLWEVAYVIIPIYLFVATIFFMVQDYAKVHIVNSDTRWIFNPIINAFKMVLKNFGRTLLLYFLNLLTFLILFFIYWKITGSLGTTSIFLAFLVGQVFIIARIGMKLLNLGSVVAWYQGKMNP